MIEQNMFIINERTHVSHPEAQFQSYKLAVPHSELIKLFNENRFPKSVFVRTYWSQKQD